MLRSPFKPCLGKLFFLFFLFCFVFWGGGGGGEGVFFSSVNSVDFGVNILSHYEFKTINHK